MLAQKGNRVFKNVMLLLVGLFLVFCMSHETLAQGKEVFPSRTVTIVVPWAAGGSSDTAARVMAKHLSEIWG